MKLYVSEFLVHFFQEFTRGTISVHWYMINSLEVFFVFYYGKCKINWYLTLTPRKQNDVKATLHMWLYFFIAKIQLRIKERSEYKEDITGKLSHAM